MSHNLIPLDFDFLTWVDRVTHFPLSFHNALRELGADPGTAFFLSRSDAVKKKQSIVALYQDYGSGYRELLDAYVADCWRQWINLKEFDDAQTP